LKILKLSELSKALIGRLGQKFSQKIFNPQNFNSLKNDAVSYIGKIKTFSPHLISMAG